MVVEATVKMCQGGKVGKRKGSTMIPPHGDIIVDGAIVDDTTHDGTIVWWYHCG